MFDKELHIYNVIDNNDAHIILVGFINENNEISGSYVIDCKEKMITDEQNNKMIDLDPRCLIAGGVVLRGQFISFKSKNNVIRRLR